MRCHVACDTTLWSEWMDGCAVYVLYVCVGRCGRWLWGHTVAIYSFMRLWWDVWSAYIARAVYFSATVMPNYATLRRIDGARDWVNTDKYACYWIAALRHPTVFFSACCFFFSEHSEAFDVECWRSGTDCRAHLYAYRVFVSASITIR